MEVSKRIILVSGMSGAGKSTATRILEDMGYHIIIKILLKSMSFFCDSFFKGICGIT